VISIIDSAQLMEMNYPVYFNKTITLNENIALSTAARQTFYNFIFPIGIVIERETIQILRDISVARGL
jgi:hypothetical protein